ncbi:MAG: hypothetical protein MI810_24040 [Flavobacteriales bacterium]|nr:hypothetical protein [Flavobacteriales bacterium]
MNLTLKISFLTIIITALGSCQTKNEPTSEPVKVKNDSTVEISTNIKIEVDYPTKDTIIYPGSNGECEGTFFIDFHSTNPSNSIYNDFDFSILSSSIAHLYNNGTFLSIYFISESKKDEFLSSDLEDPIMHGDEIAVKLNLMNTDSLFLGSYNSDNKLYASAAKFWILSNKEGRQVSSSMIVTDASVNLHALTEQEACGTFSCTTGATTFSGSFSAPLVYVEPLESTQ